MAAGPRKLTSNTLALKELGRLEDLFLTSFEDAVDKVGGLCAAIRWRRRSVGRLPAVTCVCAQSRVSRMTLSD